jgi:hypothetical protein
METKRVPRAADAPYPQPLSDAGSAVRRSLPSRSGSQIRAAFLLAPLLLLSSSLPAEEAAPRGTLRPKVAWVFKNGVALVVREGKLPIRDGIGAIAPVPPAVLGTLWLESADGNGGIQEVVSVERVTPIRRAVASLSELLAAAAGRNVTVTIRGREQSGRLLSLADPEKPERPGEALSSVLRPPSGLVALETADGIRIWPRDQIESIDLPKGSTLDTADRLVERELRFRTDRKGDSQELRLFSLSEGLGWIPEYLIETDGEGTARLTLRGLLVNDVEDLAGTEVVFVVGPPNFKLLGNASPLGTPRSLAEILSSLGRSESGSRWREPLSNFATQVALAGSGAERAVSEVPAELSDDVAAASGAELHFFSRKGVDLAKGGRGTFPLLTATAKSQEVWQWEIPDTGAFGRSGEPARRDEPPRADAVWHSLRLTNATGQPWTTAPALVLEKGHPLAQGTIFYTAPTGSTLLRLTNAPDVAVERTEVEVERIPKAYVRERTSWDGLVVEGKLAIRNAKTKSITIEVTKTLTGEVIASDGGKVERLAEAFASVNPGSRVRWEVSVPPGERKVLTYRYRVLFRP